MKASCSFGLLPLCLFSLIDPLSMRHAVAVFTLAMIWGFSVVFAPPVHAQIDAGAAAQEMPRTVSVQGEGSVPVAPDRAIVRFGVVSRAETAEGARAQNAEASSRALNAVRGLGVPDARIRMERLQLQPRREYNRETRTHEEKGYEATRQVVVEIDSLDLLPTVVTRGVQQGANRLDGIQYDLQDRQAVRNDALRRAAESAREKAQLLAETLGASLGVVQRINEQNFDFPSPIVRMEAAAMKTADQAAPEPDAYAAGEIEVSATVQVTFRLQ